jgi:hypothetical protein
MQEFEREKKKNPEADGFYSYIERDFMNSYYDKKKTRKVIYSSISIGGVLILIWNAYALYTWIFPNAQGIRVNSTIAQIGNYTTTSSLQSQIGHYLREVSYYEEKLSNHANERGNIVQSFVKDRKDPKNLIDISTAATEAQYLYKDIKSIIPPEQMQMYHSLIINKFECILTSLQYTQEAFMVTDVNKINDCLNKANEYINKSNETIIESNKVLINIFEENRMNYSVNDGVIQYSWQE